MKYAVLLAVVLVGCEGDGWKRQPNPAAQSTSLASQPAAPKESKRVTTAPRAICKEELSTPDKLPAPEAIRDIHLGQPRNASNAGRLTEESFRKLFASARPLDANDPANRRWAYAPWYSGTFTVHSVVYRFELYLGGRGKLVTQDGKVLLFSFDKVKKRTN